MDGQGLIVIGVNRSGTSALAAALKELGVYFGLDEDLPRKGLRIDYESFENRHIVEIGGTILREFEKDGLPARTVPADWMEYADLPYKLNSAAKFIGVYFSNRKLWGWKDPRSSLLIPFFESVFRELGVKPLYLMTVRHPMEVALGLHARQDLPIRDGIGHWVHYTLTALSQAAPDRLVLVPFRELVKDPRLILEPIWTSRRLGSPTTAQWERVRTVVRPEWDRTRATENGLPSIALRLWDLINSLPAGHSLSASSPERDRLNTIVAEWREWSELTRLSAIPVGEVRWVVGSERGALAYSGERVWHSFQIELSCGNNEDVHLWFLPRYRIAFLRNIRFTSSNGVIEVQPIVHEGACAERAGNGEFKVFAFGAAEHVSVPKPPGLGVTKLQFELQVVAGKQGALQTAHRLAGAMGS